MNFIFDYGKKFFLTGKMKHACWRENRSSVSKKFRATQTATIRNRRGEQISVLIACLSQVDRIGLCAQFPAFPRRGEPRSKLKMQATKPDPTGRVSTCVPRPTQPMIRQIFLIGLIAAF